MSNIKYFLTLVFTIFISQINCVKATCEIGNEADLHSPRIVILGGKGVSLANILLGQETNPQDGSPTLDPCAQRGKYLGNGKIHWENKRS